MAGKIVTLKHQRNINDGELVGMEVGANLWSFTLPDGMEFEELTSRPSIWANVVRRFDAKFQHIIYVFNAERTMCAQLYVRAVQQSQLVVSVLVEPKHFGPRQIVSVGGVIPKWNVGRQGWDVVRESDNTVIQEGSKFPLKENAMEWIEASRKQFGT
jgi:hypothetical protein